MGTTYHIKPIVRDGLVFCIDPAIIITCNCAPANNLLRPYTEQNAALPDTDNADNAIIAGNELRFKNRIIV